ncbi:FAR1 DNA binding domain, zinc finger, SWIM-type, MULE transposase domain containing protein [Tanacetum coccineum]
MLSPAANTCATPSSPSNRSVTPSLKQTRCRRWLFGDDDRLVGILWVDDEAIKNYATFDDIVSFDATFRSNKYQMVFVPFTGINHHNRCITFASRLHADETAGAYLWLLKQFKEAFGKDLEAVITDQDVSMKNAIKILKGVELCKTGFHEDLGIEVCGCKEEDVKDLVSWRVAYEGYQGFEDDGGYVGRE